MMTAGFPQPTEYFAGQHWWYVRWQGGRVQSPVECILNMSSRYNRLMAEPVDGVDGDLTAPVFAPTATDIMKELGRHFSMSIDYIGWIVRHHDLSEHGVGRHVHENPAEACALAWLEKNKK